MATLNKTYVSINDWTRTKGNLIDMPITEEFYNFNKSDIDAMPVIDGHYVWMGFKLIIGGDKDVSS